MQLAFCGVCLSKLAAIKDALGRERGWRGGVRERKKNAPCAAYRLERRGHFETPTEEVSPQEAGAAAPLHL